MALQVLKRRFSQQPASRELKYDNGIECKTSLYGIRRAGMHVASSQFMQYSRRRMGAAQAAILFFRQQAVCVHYLQSDVMSHKEAGALLAEQYNLTGQSPILQGLLCDYKKRSAQVEQRNYAAKSIPNTLEWLVGRWDGVGTEYGSGAPPELIRIVRLCVFPYLDYGVSASNEGTFIAAEFQVRNAKGNLQAATGTLPVRVFPEKIETGVASKWSFEKTVDSSSGKTRLTLTLISSTNHVRLKFQKSNEKPGKPLNRKMLFELTPGLKDKAVDK